MILQIRFTKEDIALGALHDIISAYFYRREEADESALIATHELLINSYKLSGPQAPMTIHIETHHNYHEVKLTDCNGGIEDICIYPMDGSSLDESGRGLSMVKLLSDDFFVVSEGNTTHYFAKFRRS